LSLPALCCATLPSFLTVCLPRPPTSTLFPYTTLFRSDHPRAGRLLGAREVGHQLVTVGCRQLEVALRGGRAADRRQGRSGFELTDRKSTRLNSSHGSISYAVFCLKKKNNKMEH